MLDRLLDRRKRGNWHLARRIGLPVQEREESKNIDFGSLVTVLKVDSIASVVR